MLFAKKVNIDEIEYVNNCATEELATVAEVEDHICLGAEIPERCFIEVKEGYIYIGSETEEIDFYSKKDVCEQMLPTIAETYM